MLRHNNLKYAFEASKKKTSIIIVYNSIKVSTCYNLMNTLTCLKFQHFHYILFFLNSFHQSKCTKHIICYLDKSYEDWYT